MAAATKRESEPKRGPGRPEKPPAEVKSRHLNLNLDEEQLQLIKRAAATDDDKPHNWGRRMLLKLAREKLGVPTPGLDAPADGLDLPAHGHAASGKNRG